MKDYIKCVLAAFICVLALISFISLISVLIIVFYELLGAMGGLIMFVAVFSIIIGGIFYASMEEEE